MRKNFFQLLIQLAVAVAICVATAAGQTPADLPPLANVERELKGGETQSFRVALTAGQFVHAVVEQKDADIVAEAFGPDGKLLSTCDSPNDRWGFESVLFVAPVAGDYRVDVRSGSPRAPVGRYRLQVIAVRDATEIDKGHAAAMAAYEEGRKLRVQQSPASKRAAVEKYEQALPLFHAAGDKYREAMTSLSIGIAYYPLNEFRKALDYFNRTVALTVELGDRRFEASTQTWIAGMLDILGDVTQALEHHNRALTLAREGHWRVVEGIALSSMGKIYSDLAEWQKALELYDQALPIFTELDSKQNQAITLNNIGIAYDQAGDFQKGLDYLQQSLPLLRTVGNKNSEAYTLLNIGRVHARLNDYEKALDYYGQAQAIQKQTGNRAQEAETIDEMGQAYSAAGQQQKALEFHQQAVRIQREVGNVRREAIALRHSGDVYNKLGQPQKALEQFNAALATFRAIGDLNNAAAALEGSARAEQQRGNLAAARKHIEESLALIETVRSRSSSLEMRASYRATVENAYEFYVDVLMQQHVKEPSRGYDAQALQASERARARSFLERLSEAKIDIRQGVDASLIEKERDLTRVLNAKAQREMQVKLRKGGNEELAALQKEISGLEEEYQQVQAAIRKSSPQYAALTQPQPIGLREIQQQLDPTTVLLEYSLGAERSYLWAVTPDSLKTYVLPKREEVEKVAREVYEALTARSVTKSLESPAQRKTRIAEADSQFQQSAGELSRMILAPAAGEFGGKRLVVVTDDALQVIPFAALSVGPAQRPLIVDHEVVSLPSASAFAVQRQNLSDRKPAPRGVAVIADPVFSAADSRLKSGAEPVAQASTRIIEHLPGPNGGQLSIARLPFTRWEADQILAVAPPGANFKAVDFRANRSLVTSGELSNYRYVHFATHGYLDTTRANLSALVLSLVDEQGKPQDGFLRTHDIYNLKLPAELVVLSACETGLGKDTQGEGLEGVTRGFMYAGARRVVMSLWNVNDKATAALMQRLYAGLLRNNKTPAAALRAAQIEMLRSRQWQSPYYWAPFVMQGEWR
jgi:CHAT domain-containing protein/tetratricopeptide (TPR) repeat protein